MVPGLGPTPSSSQDDDSPKKPPAEGDEEGSVDSIQSVSSMTSEVGATVDPSIMNYLEVRPEFCREKCRRPAHALSRKKGLRAPPGIYRAVVSPAGRVIGALPDSRMSSEELESVAAARRVADAELVALARASRAKEVQVEDVDSDSSPPVPVAPRPLPVPTSGAGKIQKSN
eukprot:scaffold162819_cov41-Attheya_sp.AAC.1